MFDFLIDIVPRDDTMALVGGSRGVNDSRSSVDEVDDGLGRPSVDDEFPSSIRGLTPPPLHGPRHRLVAGVAGVTNTNEDDERVAAEVAAAANGSEELAMADVGLARVSPL